MPFIRFKRSVVVIPAITGEDERRDRASARRYLSECRQVEGSARIVRGLWPSTAAAISVAARGAGKGKGKIPTDGWSIVWTAIRQPLVPLPRRLALADAPGHKR